MSSMQNKIKGDNIGAAYMICYLQVIKDMKSWQAIKNWRDVNFPKTNEQMIPNRKLDARQFLNTFSKNFLNQWKQGTTFSENSKSLLLFQNLKPTNDAKFKSLPCFDFWTKKIKAWNVASGKLKFWRRKQPSEKKKHKNGEWGTSAVSEEQKHNIRRNHSL